MFSAAWVNFQGSFAMQHSVYKLWVKPMCSMHGKYLDIQSLSAPINFYLSKIYQVKKINMHKSYSLLGLDYKQMSAVYQQMLLNFFFFKIS